MSDERVQVTTDEFRNVMGHFASGVTVITADDEGTPVGTTASAFTSLSLDPPMLLVCLNKESHTGQVVSRTGKFGVNILGEDGPDLAMRFARKGDDKFAGLDWHPGSQRVPLLDHALASVECSVTEQTTGGTHYVFIAAADAASVRAGSPLAYYKGKFGRVETEVDIHASRLISNWIVTHDTPAGSLLAVDELSAELDLPRGNVYHALGALREQGVVYRDEVGAFRVATLSQKMVGEAVEARRTIELGVIKKIIGTLSEEQIGELRAAAEATALDDENPTSPDEFTRSNHDFHDKLVALGGNGSLTNVYRQFNITAIMGRVQADAGGADARDLRGYQEHHDIVEAIAANDYDAAVEAVGRHAQKAIDDARDLIEKRDATSTDAV